MTEHRPTAEQIRKNRRIAAITACVLAVAIPLALFFYNHLMYQNSPYAIVEKNFPYRSEFTKANMVNQVVPEQLMFEEELNENQTFVFYQTQLGLYSGTVVTKHLFSTDVYTQKLTIYNPAWIDYPEFSAKRYVQETYNLEDGILLVEITNQMPSSAFYGNIPATVRKATDDLYVVFCLIPQNFYSYEIDFTFTY